MKIVYASRTGNVKAIISKLEFNDAIRIETGNEYVEEEFILFTYTDGYGEVPSEVVDFLENNYELLRGVVASGDTAYGEAFCAAADVISEEHNVPVLYKVERDGSDEDIKNIKMLVETYF